MIYLYVKTHNVTGLKYLGKTKNDPFKYKGSGKLWKLHIKKHGYDVTTEILLQTETEQEIKEKGKEFSILWNIVESKNWANLKLEEGDGGGNCFNHEANKINASKGGQTLARLVKENKIVLVPWNKSKSVPRTESSIEKQRKTMTGKKRGRYNVNLSEKRILQLKQQMAGNTINLGRKQTDKEKAKRSKSGKGIFWWTNDIIEIKSKECPPGFRRGRIKKQTQ